MRELLSWQNMPIKRKDVKKRVYHDEAITYGEFYGIAVDEYIDTPTTALPFSVRVINRFMSNGITTAADLLRTTPAHLISLKGFGKTCLDEVEAYVATLQSSEHAANKLRVLSENVNKMNQERLWKPISSTCAPYPSTWAFRKAMRTTAASVSLRASSSASHMRLPVRFSQGHIQTGRHPLKTSILHKLSQGALWRMEVFLLFPSSRQNRTQSVSLSVWLSNRCSLSWVLRRSWHPPTVKGVLSAICPMRPNMNTGRISNSPYPGRSLMICSLSRFSALILQPDTPSSLLRQGIVSSLARFSWFSSFAAFTPSEQAKVSEKSF